MGEQNKMSKRISFSEDTTIKRFGITYNKVSCYNLCCGYVQRITANGCNNSLDLWREHDHYHIRYCDYDKPALEGITGNFLRIWDVTETLTEARKIFNSLLRKYQKELKS